MATRVEIPRELAARVLFASDKTCCVCRIDRGKVQIHHINKDPSNNAFENLAVVCVYCHSDAHSDAAFVRNLSPELVTLYNESWREIAKMKLLPTQGAPGNRELLSEAYLQASLDCHSWKVHFMALAGNALPSGEPGAHTDVWELLLASWIPSYSPQSFATYQPLFTESLIYVQSRLDRLGQLFADVLPPDFRATLLRAHRQLAVERDTYRFTPTLLAALGDAADAQGMFRGRFAGVVDVLGALAREADRRRSQLSEAPTVAA